MYNLTNDKDDNKAINNVKGHPKTLDTLKLRAETLIV